MEVYFFVPNVIGYVRVVLNLSAFFVMLERPYLTVALHFTGGIFLDVVDGATARYLNQCRCGRIGMLMGSCVLYPQYLFAFQLLVCLEVAGCWSNQYRCALRSDPKNVWQKIRSTDPWILRIFFQEPTLTLVIFGQDMCVSMCYLLYFSPGPTVFLAGNSHSLWKVMAWLGVPFLIYRQIIVCGLLLISSFGELARLHRHQEWDAATKTK